MKILLEAKEVKEIIEKHLLQTTGFNVNVVSDTKDAVATFADTAEPTPTGLVHRSSTKEESVEEPDEDVELEALKKEAKKMGISIRGNISKETLEERIREHEAEVQANIDEGLGEDSEPEWEEEEEEADELTEEDLEEVMPSKDEEEADPQEEEEQPRKKSIFAKR